LRPCCVLLLSGLAAVLLNTGCQTANSTPNSGGSAGSSSPGSAWSMYPPEPKKVQTPADFISLQRPENFGSN
jgi:hypothetical protein